MAEAAAVAEIKCHGRDCMKEPVVYCNNCKQLLCETHQEAHDMFTSTLSTPHEVISYREFQRQPSSSCDVHKMTVMGGCMSCFKPFCPKCLDDNATGSSNCSADGQAKHYPRSAEDVVKKIQTELKEMLSELRVKELTHMDEMKELRKTYDEEMEENRTDLDKLSVTVQQLHKMLDKFADEMRNGMMTHMKMKEEIMKKCESDYSEYQKNCEEVHDLMSEFLKLENEVILKNQQMMKDKLEPLKSLQLEHETFPAKLSIPFHSLFGVISDILV